MAEPEHWAPVFSMRPTREIIDALEKRSKKSGWTKAWIACEILGRALKLPKECRHGTKTKRTFNVEKRRRARRKGLVD